MKTTLSLLALVATIVAMTATGLFTKSMNSVGTAVIATKSEKQVGGGFAQLLPDDLSKKQHVILNTAYAIAKEDGHKNPELLQGIILQESKAGALKSYKVANPGPNAYFGLAQIKVVAARDVLNRWPEMYERYGFHTRTDDEIKAHLILDDRFNLEVASKYLKILKSESGYSDDAALAGAYNQGAAGARVHVEQARAYANSVMKFMQQLKN